MEKGHGGQPQVQRLEFFFARADNSCPPPFEIIRQLASDLFIKGFDIVIFIQADAIGRIQDHHALIVRNGWRLQVEKIIADRTDALEHPVSGAGVFQVVNGCLVQVSC